jgi:hypothetical protein
MGNGPHILKDCVGETPKITLRASATLRLRPSRGLLDHPEMFKNSAGTVILLSVALLITPLPAAAEESPFAEAVASGSRTVDAGRPRLRIPARLLDAAAAAETVDDRKDQAELRTGLRDVLIFSVLVAGITAVVVALNDDDTVPVVYGAR